MNLAWEARPLGEVFQLEYGKPLDEEHRNVDGRYPVYGANGEKDRTDKFYSDKPSIIVGRKGSAGEVNLTEERFWPLDVTYFLKFDDKRYGLRFLFYLLKSLGLPSLAKGVKPGINRNEIYSIVVRIPPLPEQQRIVAILDKAFAAIATAKANTEKNLLNARALFDSQLDNVFVRRGAAWNKETLQTLLDKGWIEDHLDGNHGSDYPRKEEFVSKGVPYISANCIDNDNVDLGKAKYLSPVRAAQIRKGVAKDGDVLFAHNATVGPVSILRTEQPKVILGTSLTYYRCNIEYILPEYLAHYMRSAAFTSQYEAVMRQSTRNQVPITKQREFQHIIPPLPEQRKIVQQLDHLLVGTHRLASLYSEDLSSQESLKQSILAQAFTGEL